MCLYIKTEENRALLTFLYQDKKTKNHLPKFIRFAMGVKNFAYKIEDGLELINHVSSQYGILYSKVFEDYSYSFTKNRYGLKAKIDNKVQSVGITTNALYVNLINKLDSMYYRDIYDIKMGYHISTFKMEEKENEDKTLGKRLYNGFNLFCIEKSRMSKNYYNINIPVMIDRHDIQLIDDKDVVAKSFTILKPEILSIFYDTYKEYIKTFNDEFFYDYKKMYNNLINTNILMRE